MTCSLEGATLSPWWRGGAIFLPEEGSGIRADDSFLFSGGGPTEKELGTEGIVSDVREGNFQQHGSDVVKTKRLYL